MAHSWGCEMKNTLRASTSAFAFAGVSALAFGLATPAAAGNIILTGHDMDFHCGFGHASTCTTLSSEVAFVRNGNALPVLTIDASTELQNSLTAIGVAFVNKT